MTDKEWRELVLDRIQAIDCRTIQLLSEVAALKVKAGLWGILGGALTIGLSIGVLAVRSLIN